MTVPWGDYPDGTFGDDLSGLNGLNEASWRAGLNARVLGSGSGGTGFNGMNGVFSGIRNTLGGHATELAGLQSTTQKLEGIIGYAHGYIDGGWSGQLGPQKRNVNSVIGSTEGVTRQSGAYYLHSKGLWISDARLNIDQAGAFVGEASELQIRVYSPSGSLHAIAVSLEDTARRHCHIVHLPFTVPSAGYYVEFWANIAVARNAWGGSQFNGLSVEKRSLETE